MPHRVAAKADADVPFHLWLGGDIGYQASGRGRAAMVAALRT